LIAMLGNQFRNELGLLFVLTHFYILCSSTVLNYALKLMRTPIYCATRQGSSSSAEYEKSAMDDNQHTISWKSVPACTAFWTVSRHIEKVQQSTKNRRNTAMCR